MNLRFSLTYILLLASLRICALEPVTWNQRYQDYIDQYKDIAIMQMLHWHIPASITLAQGLLESGAGHSELTRKANNHFGIKCHDWTGPTSYHDDDESGECFRRYGSAYESFEDHSKFLAQKPRYRRLFDLKIKDYKGWANGLKACGYATNPRYASSLINIIECYRLYEYDNATSYNKYNIHNPKHQSKSSQYVQAPNEHIVKMNNKNYYVIAKRGDTFKSIGKEFGVSYRKLAKYNERDKKDQLEDGEIIYLEKKRTKADKIYKKRPHVVQRGESMYSIAQKYGVRLKSLYKKNDLDPDYKLRVGDSIKVY